MLPIFFLNADPRQRQHLLQPAGPGEQEESRLSRAGREWWFRGTRPAIDQRRSPSGLRCGRGTRRLVSRLLCQPCAGCEGSVVAVRCLQANGKWIEPQALEPHLEGLESLLRPDLKTLYFEADETSGTMTHGRIFQVALLAYIINRLAFC